MTILVITREYEKIICYSDSRVTHRPSGTIRTVTDHFSKILILPFKVSIGKVGKEQLREVRGEFGYAFAGDILFATALYSMASNIFSNLHDESAEYPPNFHSFVETLTRLANILIEDDIFNAKNREYTVFIFGPCPLTKELKIFQIALDHGATPLRFSFFEVEIQETGFRIVGSGMNSFFDHVDKNKHKAATFPYAEILLDTILEEKNPTIGGNLQQCVATQDGVRIVPIIHPINGGESLDIHISGISTEVIGKVGEFSIGYQAVGFRVLHVIGTQWLLKNGFSKDRSVNPDYINATADLMANLQHWQASEGQSAGIHSFVKFLSPSEIVPERFYFLGRCENCRRLCPVLEDPSVGKKPEPFFGKGGIIGTCCHCQSEVRVPVSRLRSRKGSKK